MSKNVTFYLGPTTGLTARQLTITRIVRAGDDVAPAAQYDADAGAVETVTVNLPDNQIWRAVLVDTGPGGVDRPEQAFSFHTADLTYLSAAARQPEGSQFRILDTEDLSSSSSASSSSSSSSSNSVSSSSSSSSPSSSSSSSSFSRSLSSSSSSSFSRSLSSASSSSSASVSSTSSASSGSSGL